MAYVSKEDKAKLAPLVKAVLKKYGMKGTIAVHNHSTIVCNIKSGKLDLIGSANKCNAASGSDHTSTIKEYFSPNVYWAEDRAEKVGDTKIASFYRELTEALRGPDFFDNSDIMTDYFDRSHYYDVNVGRYNKPYILDA